MIIKLSVITSKLVASKLVIEKCFLLTLKAAPIEIILLRN